MTEEKDVRGLRASAIQGDAAHLRKLAADAEKYLEGWKRARADYENLHRRTADERRLARAEGREDAFLSLVGVLDYFDAAFAAIPQEIASHPWVDGVRHIHKALHHALETNGIEALSADGALFDPVKHEAVEHAPHDLPAGTVLETLAKGYVLEGKVLRPAKVRVSSGKEKPQEPAVESASRGDASRLSTRETSHVATSNHS